MDLRSIDLNLLVSLDALLRERQVTLAAERMWVTQPAMSASLARLRTLFDDPLLVRAGRSLVLTAFGESLREPLGDILGSIDVMLTNRPEFDPASDARIFSVAASDYITLVLLRDVVGRLSTLAPGIHLHVQPVLPGYVDRLRQDTIDLIVLPREVAEGVGDISSATLFVDRFICAAGDDRAAELAALTVEEFSALPYIAYHVNGEPSHVDHQLDRLGIPRNVEMTTESFLIAPFLLSGTGFIAMLHERLAMTVSESARITILEPPIALEPVTQTLLWHPRHEDDPAHRWLRDLMVDVARNLDDRT